MEPETLEKIKKWLCGFSWGESTNWIQELVEAYEKLVKDKIPQDVKKQTVCVDFDGVLAQYDGWKGIDHIGEPIPGAQGFIMDLAGMGCDVVIYTTRCNPDVNLVGSMEELKDHVRRWMRKHHFPRCEIYTGRGKPLAAAYVDDRAVVCRPQDGRAYHYLTALDEVGRLLRSEK